MIYLDNAATTFPKPQSVSRAVNEALRVYGANPGRSGHKQSMRSSKEIYDCRVKAAALFHARKEEHVVFTLNCTHSLNIVFKGLLKSGDHVVTSDMEHNSVMRPLHELEKNGVTFTQARVFPGDNDKTVDSFRDAICKDTKLVVCTHASNVWGVRLPIERIGALCHEYGVQFMVDGAQTAGTFPIDVQDTHIDYLCMAGHKGLYGPMGTGILITDCAERLSTLTEGGTGSGSNSFEHPTEMPDKFESGTPNLPGIVGLKAGISFVTDVRQENIARHEMELVRRLYDRFKNTPGVLLYTEKPNLNYFSPVLSFNVKGYDSETVADFLNRNYDIALRAGLHCAPSAHSAMGTLDIGAVRVSPSYFTNAAQIDRLAFGVSRLRKSGV